MSADLQNAPVPLAEISQGPNRFEEFLDRNQKNLIVLAALIAIAAAAFVVYRGIQKSAEETAGAALNKAEDLSALQAVVDQHANTSAAGSAMILLANRQWTDGQQEAAIATLRKFIAENSAHPALASARANLASKLMIQGKSEEATTLFESLVSDESARFIAPFALISLGDIAAAKGDSAKAEESYAKVKADFPDSSFGETASRRISTLKAKAPVEIDAPPAPPAPPAGADGSGVAPGLTPIPGAPALDLPAPTTPEPAPAAPVPAE